MDNEVFTVIITSPFFSYEIEKKGKKKNKKQGRIHGNPCRDRLGMGSNELGRGSNELGRGSNDYSHTKSKSVTDRPTNTMTDIVS